jgi:hypothetical protein
MPPTTTPIATAAIAGRPTAGINGTSRTMDAMLPTLKSAGESAGMKNRFSAFSMPMNAAATATSVRKGSMMRASWTVSSSLPGTAS